MDLELSGKRAIVTGGSRGIGKVIAQVLVAEGVDVVIAARGKEQLESTAHEVVGYLRTAPRRGAHTHRRGRGQPRRHQLLTRRPLKCQSGRNYWIACARNRP
jgi:NAD(P)-dependent dehydrogenase (short-subunit alcohol dehydrogenase family)